MRGERERGREGMRERGEREREQARIHRRRAGNLTVHAFYLTCVIVEIVNYFSIAIYDHSQKK
jgi:hypothetical protein